MQVRERHTTKRTGCRKWLFACEMDKRFGEEVAQIMRDAKLADPHLKATEVRYFPGVPQSEKTRQFKTLVDDTEDDIHEEEVDRLFSCLDESSSSSSGKRPKGGKNGGGKKDKKEKKTKKVDKKVDKKDKKEKKEKAEDPPDVAAQKALIKNCKKALALETILD